MSIRGRTAEFDHCVERAERAQADRHLRGDLADRAGGRVWRHVAAGRRRRRHPYRRRYARGADAARRATPSGASFVGSTNALVPVSGATTVLPQATATLPPPTLASTGDEFATTAANAHVYRHEFATATADEYAAADRDAQLKPSNSAPTRTATKVPPILLLFDGDSLVLSNRSTRRVNISNLGFPGGICWAYVTFYADQWESPRLGSMPPGSCFVIWRNNRGEVATPDYCARVKRGLPPGRAVASGSAARRTRFSRFGLARSDRHLRDQRGRVRFRSRRVKSASPPIDAYNS